MPFFTADLLDALGESYQREKRPWGIMCSVGSAGHDLTVKYLEVEAGHRTSFQSHERKDELIIVLSGTGHIEVAGIRWRGAGAGVRIRPGCPHRVTGPLAYLEVSTYDDGTDTIRLADDYGRAP